jgi:formamidopyrimidine-DNA glycosylase
MPELPDVETYRRYLNATGLHQRIASTDVESAAVLAGTTPRGLARALEGTSFESTRRHGKYLFASLARGGWLVLHFGMTGELKYFKHREDAPDYTQCLITYDNGFHLAYAAPRKLGRIGLTDSPQRLIQDKELGPDALDLNAEAFVELASKRRGSIKPWLMNQEIMAGIGNIYSDEILFQAGLHPRRSVGELDETTLRRLHRVLCSVLEAAIKARVDPIQMPAGFLLPHRRKGGRCPKCGTHLKTVKAAGRTAWYCPRCQPL